MRFLALPVSAALSCEEEFAIDFGFFNQIAGKLNSDIRINEDYDRCLDAGHKYFLAELHSRVRALEASVGLCAPASCVEGIHSFFLARGAKGGRG